MSGITLSIGLEYIDAVFNTIKNSDFSQYTITGMKTLAILFFLINILKKYNEGVANNEGYTWGLTPAELAKNFAVIILVLFSTQVLGVFDSILVAIETQYRDTAPALLPLQMQDIDLEQDVGALFLAERYFLLGIMQAFFPLVISLAVFEKFRSLAYNFFKLYAGVYMLVPAFFLVNVFVNNLYTEINTNFWGDLFGTDWGSNFFAPLLQLGSIGFIVLLKFKLYRRATSFVFRLFSA